MKKILVAALVLLLAIVAFANMPAPFQAGDAAFEPLAVAQSPASESVLIDMSALASGDPAVVVTTTLIFKDGSPKPNPAGVPGSPESTSGPGYRNFALVIKDGTEVLLDGVPVDTSGWERSNGVADWAKPEATYWFGGKPLTYAFRPQQGARGGIPIATGGDHTLVIREKFSPSRNVSDNTLTKYWQFAYIFGRRSLLLTPPPTDVEVRVPEGWDVVTTPSVGAGDGILKGIVDRSANPEAVLITTTLRAPASYWRLKSVAGVMILISLLGIPLVGALLCWIRFSASRWWWLYGVGFALVWSGMTALSTYLSEYAASLTIPDAQLAHYGYGELGSMLLIAALTGATLVLAFPLWLVVYRFATRKSRQEADAPAES